MRKKLTLTIDADVYDKIKELPRTVSISEVVSWVLKAMYQEIKSGKEMTSEEIGKWADSTPEGRDFRDRLTEHWGPAVLKMDDAIKGMKKKVIPGRKRARKKDGK